MSKISGDNGTIDGQGAFWWQQFHGGKLKYTRGYLIELLHSDRIFISNLTLLNSPAWNVHPVYSRFDHFLKPNLKPSFEQFFESIAVTEIVQLCSNIIISGITILAPLRSPNTDGINPGTNAVLEIWFGNLHHSSLH